MSSFFVLSFLKYVRFELFILSYNDFKLISDILIVSFKIKITLNFTKSQKSSINNFG
jgi:hypothetical protein